MPPFTDKAASFARTETEEGTVGEDYDAKKIREFARLILHGDEEHRDWLIEAADAFIAGEEMPPPRGKGLPPTTEPRS